MARRGTRSRSPTRRRRPRPRSTSAASRSSGPSQRLRAAQAERACRELQQELGDGCHLYTRGGWGEPKPTLVVAIPAAAGKAKAAAHVRKKLGFAPATCVAAGDSGNDATMLASGLAFVLVANAADELVREADARPEPSLHYRAAAAHAEGCIEGIRHFRSVTRTE